MPRTIAEVIDRFARGDIDPNSEMARALLRQIMSAPGLDMHAPVHDDMFDDDDDMFDEEYDDEPAPRAPAPARTDGTAHVCVYC